VEKYRNPHGQRKENLFLPLFNTNFISIILWLPILPISFITKVCELGFLLCWGVLDIAICDKVNLYFTEDWNSLLCTKCQYTRQEHVVQGSGLYWSPFLICCPWYKQSSHLGQHTSCLGWVHFTSQTGVIQVVLPA
jgi:hypothetical protein